MPTGAAAARAATQGRPKQEKTGKKLEPGSLAGNLTADPDLRFTAEGRPVTSLYIAVNERRKNEATGKWEDGDTSFFTVVVWGQQAENVTEYLAKGDRIVAEGEWTEQSYTDKDDNPQTKVVLTARDIGPSLLFRGARVLRQDRQRPPRNQVREQPGDDSPWPDENGNR